MIELLKILISTPSFSGEEDKTSSAIFNYLTSQGVTAKRYLNNVTAVNKHFTAGKPTLLLNSHHDTVKPSSAYTRDPFKPTEENDKIYGLGSNDAGASVVALSSAFCKIYDKHLPFNVVLALTAEEESMCKNGITALWPQLPKIDFVIVGEPTQMKAARAERGLLVIDCVSKGVSGHAARNEGVNAIYEAMKDIDIMRNLRFEKVSDLMGEVKLSVTVINAGTQHNVVPAECKFIADIRPTDKYDNQEIVDIIRQNVKCEVTPRSLNLKASALDEKHILMDTVRALGIEAYISPTTSDISRIPVPALKMGPGDSARSHTADEYIYIDELIEGEKAYITFLNKLSELIK